MPDVSVGYGTLFALFLLICASVWMGAIAQRVVERGSFVKSYFLGNRGLGAWTLALTATVQSGGTFMGFPSLVYAYGWIVALFIASYMVVPITGFGILGKRLAQLSRRTGAITVPDLFRERFGSKAVGMTSMWFILLFMSFMMVAQFKAGALIMKVSWPGSGSIALTEGDEPSSDADATKSSDSSDSNSNPADSKTTPSKAASKPAGSSAYDRYYYLGLTIFALTVVGYTLIGGFLAAVWTDLFQSIMMVVGVSMLLMFSLSAVGPGGLEEASRSAVEQTGPGYVQGPGYSADPGRAFLPISLAFSYFFVWVFAGMGSPAGMVRIMASRSTDTIRRSMCLLSTYNMFIYIPLIVICICGRKLIPALPPAQSDEFIPRMAILLTNELPLGSFLAGLILTAPFGAVMATVSGYLVVIASALVRDIYQHYFRPRATQAEIRRVTYIAMLLVGGIAYVANLSPVDFLQAIVIFSGTGGGATFVVAGLMACFWRRASAAGTVAAMLGGATVHIGLYITGWVLNSYGIGQSIGPASKFSPYYLLGLDPIVWGMLASLVAGVTVTLMTPPPNQKLIARMFDLESPQPQAA